MTKVVDAAVVVLVYCLYRGNTKISMSYSRCYGSKHFYYYPSTIPPYLCWFWGLLSFPV